MRTDSEKLALASIGCFVAAFCIGGVGFAPHPLNAYVIPLQGLTTIGLLAAAAICMTIAAVRLFWIDKRVMMGVAATLGAVAEWAVAIWAATYPLMHFLAR